MDRLILDLCGGTGSWSRPYAKAGYRVIIVDPKGRKDGDFEAPNVTRCQLDVDDFPEIPCHGILAAPPCTELASSGARWWKDKPSWKLEAALDVVRRCLDIIDTLKPKWWCLENPVGRLPSYIGYWKHTFDPCDYGDPYTKKTCLWGEFQMPEKHRIEPTEGSRLWRLPPGPERARLRSTTPEGFAKAFFEANP